MKNLPVPLQYLIVQIKCPSHQVWPRSRVPATVAAPAANLNLKTFEWRCVVCGDCGLLTRAFRADFVRSKA